MLIIFDIQVCLTLFLSRLLKEMANEYEHNLANFIRDVRHDLNIPDLPFAIANSGMIGYDTTQPSRREDVINAEMKVATYPEFQGSVASVDTRPFARSTSSIISF